ncbi:C-reactive protein [Xenopus laevis]|uniref:Pentraxin family member n=2 Tax=Xenopus laevis TaxID=8355 RepID=A0A1L8FBQ0_XENLA|nr:C-reactive protein [Xenopus laevis]OCT69015.1 hypothetical protein XELAEV_18040323mg [Xenopus laevis]
MEIQIFCLLLCYGSMAQEDMDRSVFLFPMQSAADYVVLTPMVTEPLRKLTVCLRSYTEGRRYAFFTTDTPNSQIHNFVFFQMPTSNCISNCPSYIYLNNAHASFNVKTDTLEWIHRCVTWDSDTGVLQLWVNGKVSPRTVLKKGFSIDLPNGITLGQMRRASYETGWDYQTSFHGEISDVHMWNEVLSPETIRQVLLNNRDINGNVISWRSLKYTIKGDVTVQPKLQCRYDSESASSHYQCSMD